jgi:hypothetical protein
VVIPNVGAGREVAAVGAGRRIWGHFGLFMLHIISHIVKKMQKDKLSCDEQIYVERSITVVREEKSSKCKQRWDKDQFPFFKLFNSILYMNILNIMIHVGNLRKHVCTLKKFPLHMQMHKYYILTFAKQVVQNITCGS